MGATKTMALEMQEERVNKSLYNITLDQLILINELEDADGELTDDLESRLEITKSEINHKSIAYLSVIRGKEVENLAIKEEIKRLQGLVKRNDNLTNRLKNNLLNAVKVFGSFEVGFNKFGTRKSSTVQVDNVNSLPADYKTIKIVESADKKALKEAIKAGVEIEGVRIENNLNLKIN